MGWCCVYAKCKYIVYLHILCLHIIGWVLNFSFVISNDVFGFITILFDIIKISDEGFPFDLDLVYGVCLFVNKWFGFHLHFSALCPIVWLPIKCICMSASFISIASFTKMAIHR